jgi:large subunit ribosomal protein L23
MLYYNIIKRPLITEKNMEGISNKKYTFEVDKNSNKLQIKEAIENIFNVNVIKVTTINCNGKSRKVGKNRGMRSNWKKAFVKLKAGSKTIELFEGIN